ncbi:hypothetical protein CKO43_06795 [Rubrivivax gelatinosus]|uniref:Glycosyltransferase involved in cell wall biosynthesis n=2 Tax=Rubrivivax gelatinosus TaxID=28068 RepID=A0ABS1DUP5_RUBGE|nr:hypothetical protein [Rubrivivax gelatinosus]
MALRASGHALLRLRSVAGHMKLLFVHAGAELYGADRILLELVGGLLQAGHECRVVLPGDGPLRPALEGVGAVVGLHNLGVLRRRYFTPAGLLNRALRLKRAVAFISGLIRDHGIEVVHTNTTAVFAGALAARRCGVPHVWHVHEITTRPHWYAALVARLLERWSQQVVTVSDATRRHLCALNPALVAKTATVYNGIDPARAVGGVRGRVRESHGWPADAIVVGMIGRINWWKGQGTLVDSAAVLLARRDDLRFLLVGGVFAGEEALREQLLAQVGALGPRAACVAVEDFRPDIADVLADIDVFVLPSIEPDPFPTVVLEAMAASKPIVAFGHGGVVEMVDGGRAGLLCPPVSAQALAQAIETLADSADERRRLGGLARQRVGERFTQRAFLDAFARVYRESLEARP